MLIREVDPARDPRASIPEFGVTNAFFVPAVIQFLLLTPGVDETDFSTLRAIVYGASPITDTVLMQAMDVVRLRVHPGLRAHRDDRRDHAARPEPTTIRSAGPTCCGRAASRTRGSRSASSTPRPATTCADGEVGELWTRSHQNMLGYWANEDATRAAIDDDGWFKTGDAGYRDADGFLFLHDRVKDMIVSGGENIYPAEVENVLAKHPDVADVAVIGVPDEKWGEAVKAVVVRHATGSDVDEDDLIAFAREYLAGYKLPKSVDFADELPRNPSGKLLKRELPRALLGRRERQIG